MGVMEYFKPNTITHDIILVVKKDVRFVFECEELTKFLEKTTISYGR